MNFLQELLALNNPQQIAQISESMDYFDIDKLQFDPDRTSVVDIEYALLPLLVKMGYIQLMHDKGVHDSKNWDSEDSEFKLTTDDLVDKVEDVIGNLVRRLKEVSIDDIKQSIKILNKDFKTPLSE